MQTLKSFIQTLVNSFQVKTRNICDTFYCVKDRAPCYISDLCHYAHDGMMPDDYKYQYIVEALEYINDNLDPFGDDSLDEIDVYDACEPDYMNHDLLKWLSSNLERMEYVDQVLAGMETPTLSTALMMAQSEERAEVMQAVINWIGSKQGELWDLALLIYDN